MFDEKVCNFPYPIRVCIFMTSQIQVSRSSGLQIPYGFSAQSLMEYLYMGNATFALIPPSRKIAVLFSKLIKTHPQQNDIPEDVHIMLTNSWQSNSLQLSKRQMQGPGAYTCNCLMVNFRPSVPFFWNQQLCCCKQIHVSWKSWVHGMNHWRTW